MLCDRLRELKATGLVEREVKPVTPVQVRYQLTAKGEGLGPVLDELSRWANQWIGIDRAAATPPVPPMPHAAGGPVNPPRKERG